MDYSKLKTAARNTDHINGLTHNFYRYPARFSPVFARAAIQAFSDSGGLVLDPFVGGGTTLVEASILGRKSIGVDISNLATFISEVKTTPLRQNESLAIQKWTKKIKSLTLSGHKVRVRNLNAQNYRRNINDAETWRIRNLIELALNELQIIPDRKVSNFIRCALLKTGQWALDGRKNIPSMEEFRKRLNNDINEMLAGIIEYSTIVKQYPIWEDGETTKIINRSAIGLEEEKRLFDHAPQLILMSPPYPGVHVLYHRWQVKGRRETPAPFWIANKFDGNGASYFTFGDRKTHQQKKYFNEIKKVFDSLSQIADNNTTIVQMIAFADPVIHLPRYLRCLEKTGFKEFFISNKKTHKRIWRDVPNRKWHADFKGRTSGSKEVVLIHRKAK